MEPVLARNHHRWPKQNVWRRPGPSTNIHLRRALRAFRRETHEYFRDTSLHGFKYITSPDSTIFERTLWVLICVTGIVFSVILMWLVWLRFQQNPTVTTIDTTSHPIWELPFPAVSICNFNKIYQPNVDRISIDFRKVGLNDTEIEDFIQSLPKLIRPEYINVNIAPGMRALSELGHTVEDLMQQLMQPCDKLLIKCAWLGQIYNCSKMFQTIKSIEGFCCAFNYHALISDLKTKDLVPWDAPRMPANVEEPVVPEKTSESTDSADSVPGVDRIEMVAGAGRDVGLTVVFDVESHLYGGATRPYFGAAVLINDPEDYPEISLLTAQAQPGTELDIAITGTIIQSVQNVRSLDITQRQCWFGDEAKLGSADEYSYQTCVTECRIEHIKKLCNCIPFYYPLIDPNARICELSDVRCMRTNRRILSSLQTPIDVEAENKTFDEAECNCLPQCSDKWYSIFTETANVANIKYDAPMLDYYSYGLDIRNLTLLHVYFRDITCLKYRKDILITWDGLFASFGGIFGLCLGGSVISLIELMYYYMVRVFHRKKHQPTPIYSINSVASKLQNKGLRKVDRTVDGKLDNLKIFKNNVNFHSNKYTWSEIGSLSTDMKSFNAATRFKHNKVLS